jgi:hypothetical protein
MTMEQSRFNARELCSRKLWQLVTTPSEENIGERELQQAIEELATRRRYLEELQRIGKLEEQKSGA